MLFFRNLLAIFSMVFMTMTTHAAKLQLDFMPDKAKQLANDAVKVVAQVSGQHLDYSPESLKIIDQVVLKFRKDGKTTGEINKTLVAFGCYVGEVMVRNLGYKWENPDEKEMALGFDITGIRTTDGGLVNPVGKIFKLMKNGEEDNTVTFYAVYSKNPIDLIKRQKSVPHNGK